MNPLAGGQEAAASFASAAMTGANGAEEHQAPVASSDVEAPPRVIGSEAGEVREASATTRRYEPSGKHQAHPASPAASTILQPGRTACDAYPACQFRGEGIPLRDHMRECSDSEAGAIYRVLAWAGAQR